MLFRCNIFVLIWIGSLICTKAEEAPSNIDVQHRNAAQVTSSYNVRALARAPSSIRSVKRDTVYKNSTVLDKSWTDATLFKFAVGTSSKSSSIKTEIEVICKTCYIKGTATVQLTIAENFSASQAFHNFTSQVESDIKNITTAATAFIEKEATTLWTALTSGNFDVDFPTIPLDFDLDVPKIPETQLHFQFDGLELYMQFNTKLIGATYIHNLYTSRSPIGVSDGRGTEVGIILAIDLILSVETDVNIGSGFHIKLNDGVVINLAMFGKNVSSIILKGGHFEFLPVTFSTSGGFELSAVLRVGIRAGLSIGEPKLLFSSGAEVGDYANIAEFTTNVTTGTGTCAYVVEEVYSMAIGAQAGATLAVAQHTWGPTPNKSTVLFFTTLASICVTTSLPSTSAGLSARAVATTGLTTTTVSAKITYTATGCLSTGVLNCPVSLQTSSKTTVTSTIITAVPSGSKATFPVTTQNSVASTVAFGANSKALVSSSGAPTSYNPSAPTNKFEGVVNDKTGGTNNKIIIGLSVGLGIPVSLGLIAGCFFFTRYRSSRDARRDEMAIAYTGVRVPTPPPYGPYEPTSPVSVEKSPGVNVIGRFGDY